MRQTLYFCAGELAERSNAAVLKTVVLNRTGGSNPSLSASTELTSKEPYKRCVYGVFSFTLTNPKLTIYRQVNASSANPTRRYHAIINR